jgi:hypothetical protein
MGRGRRSALCKAPGSRTSAGGGAASFPVPFPFLFLLSSPSLPPHLPPLPESHLSLFSPLPISPLGPHAPAPTLLPSSPIFFLPYNPCTTHASARCQIYLRACVLEATSSPGRTRTSTPQKGVRVACLRCVSFLHRVSFKLCLRPLFLSLFPFDQASASQVPVWFFGFLVFSVCFRLRWESDTRGRCRDAGKGRGEETRCGGWQVPLLVLALVERARCDAMRCVLYTMRRRCGVCGDGVRSTPLLALARRCAR